MSDNPNCFNDVPGCEKMTAHSHPKAEGRPVTGPTHDVYYGGVRDGERWEIDPKVTTQEVITRNGDVYQRHPDLDGAGDRAWVHVTGKPTAASGVHVEPQQGKKYLTLQDLRTLLVTAERMGHAEDATVFGRVAWRGQALTLGIKASKPEPG